MNNNIKEHPIQFEADMIRALLQEYSAPGEYKNQDAAGAEKAFGFAHRGTDKQLLVFEAPIDLLSFIELFPKNWPNRIFACWGKPAWTACCNSLRARR